MGGGRHAGQKWKIGSDGAVWDQVAEGHKY